MRSIVLVSLLVLVGPVAAGAAARSAIKVKSVECFYVNQNVVYSLKEPGRYESGRFRCQAAVVASADSDVTLGLEFQQDGKSVGKIAGKAAVGVADKDCKVELEAPVPETLNGCMGFELVVTVGSTKRTVKVETSCPD